MTGYTEMTPLDTAIDAGKSQGKLALYFGCLRKIGHFLHHTNGRTIYDPQHDIHPGFHWSEPLLDGGLLKNGHHPDIYDGKVFWTCGGRSFWYAFFWWDNSIDHRGASNSGFYVRGFGWPEAQMAFDYACAKFPTVVARQRYPLVLQNAAKGKGSEG